jgi:hypothetical protein
MKFNARAIIWLGFAACLLAAISTAVFFVTIITHGSRGDSSLLIGNIIFGFIGVIAMLLGKYLGGLEERFTRLESRIFQQQRPDA